MNSFLAREQEVYVLNPVNATSRTGMVMEHCFAMLLQALLVGTSLLLNMATPALGNVMKAKLPSFFPYIRSLSQVTRL